VTSVTNSDSNPDYSTNKASVLRFEKYSRIILFSVNARRTSGKTIAVCELNWIVGIHILALFYHEIYSAKHAQVEVIGEIRASRLINRAENFDAIEREWMIFELYSPVLRDLQSSASTAVLPAFASDA
jgi:hypothetical protein